MLDTFDAPQFLNKFSFAFNPPRFEIWSDGDLVKSGQTYNIINAEVKNNNEGNEMISLAIADTSLFQDISHTNTFDTVFTLQDRIILATIPEPSSKDNVGIMSLRTTTGITRRGKVFNSNEPFCCSLFLLNKLIFNSSQ